MLDDERSRRIRTACREWESSLQGSTVIDVIYRIAYNRCKEKRSGPRIKASATHQSAAERRTILAVSAIAFLKGLFNEHVAMELPIYHITMLGS